MDALKSGDTRTLLSAWKTTSLCMFPCGCKHSLANDRFQSSIFNLMLAVYFHSDFQLSDSLACKINIAKFPANASNWVQYLVYCERSLRLKSKNLDCVYSVRHYCALRSCRGL
eukprot:IDg14508t1